MSKPFTIEDVRVQVEKHLTRTEASARSFAAECGTTQRVVLNLLAGRATKDHTVALRMYAAAGGKRKVTTITE